MGELAKALGRFLTRDIFYILSGLFIAATIMRVFGKAAVQPFDTLHSEPARSILFLGSAYILGFTVKEIFAFLRITIEAHCFVPSCLEKELYRRHQKKECQQPHGFDHAPVYAKIAAAGPDVQSRYDRISDVIHIFASAGTALTLCGVLLLFHSVQEALIGLLGLWLIAMSRFQAVRRMEFLAAYKGTSRGTYLLY